MADPMFNDEDAEMLFEEFDDPQPEPGAHVAPAFATSPPFWDPDRRNGRREAVRCVGKWDGVPEIRVLQNVLVTMPRELCQTAYAPSERPVQNTRYGVLMVCNVLQRINESDSDDAEFADFDETTDEDAHELLFEITKECVAIKVSFVNQMHAFNVDAPQGAAENAWFELCGLELIRQLEDVDNNEAHVMRADLVVHDELTNTLNVVMPLFNNGDLFDHIAQSPFQRRLQEDLARRWIHEILKGLFELKTLGLVHGDVKPENVLIGNDGKCRLIDLGLITRVPYAEDTVDPEPEHIVVNRHFRIHQCQRPLIQPTAALVGSLPYMPPEIWGNRMHPLRPYNGEAMDVWSAGVTLFVMLTGVQSYNVPALHDQRFAAMTGDLNGLFQDLGIVVSPRCLDLLRRMLEPDPQNRIDLSQAFLHPWFQNH